MPKVSEAHREQQAAHIRAAARRRFARGGFHATSMDEIIAETGMSSSTVYRYYPSKEALIRAVSDEKLGTVISFIDAAIASERPPSPAEALVTGLQLLGRSRLETDEVTTADRTQAARLAVNAWAEFGRDPVLQQHASDEHCAIRDRLALLAQRWIDTGTTSDRLDADTVARLFWTVSLGLVVQQVITDDITVQTAASDLQSLLA